MWGYLRELAFHARGRVDAKTRSRASVVVEDRLARWSGRLRAGETRAQ